MAAPATGTALTSINAAEDATFTPAELLPLETVDSHIEVRTLFEEAADDIDIESISNLLTAPDTSQIQTDLRALEAAAGQLFSVERIVS